MKSILKSHVILILFILTVRYLPNGNYISTLDDEDTDRIIATTCTNINKDQVAIVMGGMQLKVWFLNSKDG